MKFLEKDLETIIYETPDNLLENRGLYTIGGLRYQQVNLGAYGIADIVTVLRLPRDFKGCRKVIITVYELKQDIINVGTYLQALGYVRGIEKLIIPTVNLKKTLFQFDIVLIGSRLDTRGNFPYMLDHTPNFYAFTYKYEFDGVRFNNEGGYSLHGAQIPQATTDAVFDVMQTWKEGVSISRMLMKDPIDYNKDNLPF